MCTLVIVLVFGCTAMNTLAAQSEPLVGVPVAASEDTGTSTRGIAESTDIWSFPGMPRYGFSGAARVQTLCSNDRFTGTTKARIRCTNNPPSINLTVKLLEKQTGIDFSVSSGKIKPEDTLIRTAEIDSGSCCILRFTSGSDVSGYTERA